MMSILMEQLINITDAVFLGHVGEIELGASAKDCGNYLDMNLPMAKYLAGKFLDEVLYDIKPDRLIYPQ